MRVEPGSHPDKPNFRNPIMAKTAGTETGVFQETDPIYSSRILSNYLDYLEKHRPDVDIDALLKRAGIGRHEVQDPAHWFSQQQIDRFQEALQIAAADPTLARTVGRYAVSSEVIGPLRDFVIGALNPAASYMLVCRIAKQVSRGAAMSVKRVGWGTVEITCRPEPGVEEKPFQCENRCGIFEGVGLAFTGKLAQVTHPECWHRGDPCCRYQVTWPWTQALKWRLVRNAAMLFTFAAVPLFLLLRPETGAALPVLTGGLIVSVSALLSEHAGKNELHRTLKLQGGFGRELVEESNIRYGNALLVQEIGHASTTMRDQFELSRAVIGAVAQRLDFDRGMIMLADEKTRRLKYVAGFGHQKETERLLRGAAFHLDRPNSKGLFVRSFWDQRPFLIEDINRIEADFSERSRDFARQLGTRSLICVPIAYEKESLGILAVDNVSSRRPLQQSDMNLLMGVASQAAVSIANARAFAELAQSEEKYRSIMEGIEEGYFEVDQKGRLTFFNDASSRILGRSADQLHGLNYRSFMSEEGAKKIARGFRTLYAGNKPLKAKEVEIFRLDGTTRYLELSASLIRNSDGSTAGIRGLVRDVTERRQAEEDRRMLEAQLMQAQKMEALGTLAGGVAHDFNNLLMGIQGNTSLTMMEMDPGDPLFERLSSIEAYVKKSAHLTQQLLGFARKGKYQVQSLDLSELVANSNDLFGRTHKEIRITSRLDKALWTVAADPLQIEQVLLNLYVNAFQAMPEGGELLVVTENVQLPESRTRPFGKEPGRYVRVSVADTGVGMDETTLQRIFEPFFTTKKPGEGTGLGLASVYGIVKNHRGFIDVRSAVGRGTEFEFFFPAIEAPARVAKTNADDALGGTETLLIIDDEQMILDVTSEMLKRIGYQVKTAPNGSEGIKIFRCTKDRIPLVILDMVMPEMTGAQVFNELKKIDPGVCVLLASGYSAEKQAARMLEEPYTDFIQKPYDIRRLSRKIRSLLEKVH